MATNNSINSGQTLDSNSNVTFSTTVSNSLTSKAASALAVNTPAPATDVNGTNITISTPNGVGATASNSGSISVTTGNASGTNANAGGITVTAGNGAGTGNAGNVSLKAGVAPGAGTPGTIILTGGEQAEGTSGLAALRGGPGNGANGAGGIAEVKGGAATGSANGGAAQIAGGAGGSNGGAVTVVGGAVGNTATGGSISLTGGACGNTASAGNVTLTGGAGGTSATGGNVFLRGGAVSSGTPGKVIQDVGKLELLQDVLFTTTITSTSTIPLPRVKVTANAAITAGSLLKCSTTAFRVIEVQPGDADSTIVVGVAATGAAGAGSVLEVYGLRVVPCIANATISPTDTVEKSGAVAGRVVPAAASQGTIGAAMSSANAGETVLVALKYNEAF